MPFKVGLSERRKKFLGKKLEDIIPKVIELDVRKIILFGSLAEGSVHKSS